LRAVQFFSFSKMLKLALLASIAVAAATPARRARAPEGAPRVPRARPIDIPRRLSPNEVRDSVLNARRMEGPGIVNVGVILHTHDDVGAADEEGRRSGER
jgi:hypothetical protein